MLSIAVCLALLLQPKWRRVGQAATVSMILEFLVINLLLKNWVARVRPYHLLEDLILLVREPADYSFPSGHTGAAFAVASVMFLGMPRSIGVPALIVASLIGFSRIYLGVHFPTDVLGGVVVGCLTGFVSWKLTGLKFR